MGADDHNGLARYTNRNRWSCEKFENFFWAIWEKYLGVTILAETVGPQNTYFYRLAIVTVFPVTHITI